MYIEHFSPAFHFHTLFFREKAFESQTEDKYSHSAELSNLSSTDLNASEVVDLHESTGKEDRKGDSTEEQISTEKRFSEEESVSRVSDADTEPDEGSRKLEHSDLLSFRSLSNEDVCSQEFVTTEDKADDKEEIAGVDRDIIESEEKPKVEEPVELFQYSALPDVDAFATREEENMKTMEGITAEHDTHIIEEDGKTQYEDTILQSSSEFKSPEDSQEEAEDQAETIKNMEGMETSSDGIHKELTHTEGSDVIPKDDPLIEVSFEDVPEAQQIKEFRERQSEEHDSVEDLQTNRMEMQPQKDSRKLAAVASDQNTSVTQDHSEYEIVGVEKEVNFEGEELESESSIRKKKVETNDCILNDKDDKGAICSSNQPTSTANKENSEQKISHKNEATVKLSEGRFQRNDSNNPDIKEDETTDMVRKDQEITYKEGYSEAEDQEINDGGGEIQSTPAMESESKTLETSRDHPPKESEECQRTVVGSQPQDSGVESERTSEAKQLLEEEKAEILEDSEALFGKASISPTNCNDHQGEKWPLVCEKDTSQPDANIGDKVNFSM